MLSSSDFVLLICLHTRHPMFLLNICIYEMHVHMFYIYISYTWYLPTYICIYIYISIHDICVTIIHMSQSVVTCHPTFIIQATNRWWLNSSLKWTVSILSFKHFGDEVQKCWAVAAHCRGVGIWYYVRKRRTLCLWPNMTTKWFQQSIM